jgi:MtN3 and saliva related transmembrane protein
METATIVGTFAAVASTTSFAPQAWKTTKSRRTQDISAITYSLTVTGFMLGTAYGILLMQWPLIATNSICLVLSAFILTMKLLPRPKKEKLADILDPDARP